MLNCHFLCCFEAVFLGMYAYAYFMPAYAYLKHACSGKDQSFHKGTIFMIPKPNLGSNSIFSPPWPLGQGVLPLLRPQLVQSHLLKCLWNDFLIFSSLGYGSTSILNNSTTGSSIVCMYFVFY